MLHDAWLSGNEKSRVHTYFDRKAKEGLIPPALTKPFLDIVPENAVILDVGTGAGNWAGGFARDRNDLTIDVLDTNLDRAKLIRKENWKGEWYQQNFASFTPDKPYDGIWASNSIFFLPKQDQHSLLRRLCDGLKPGGIIAIATVDDTRVAQARSMEGFTKEELQITLNLNGCEVFKYEYEPDARFGPKGTIIPRHIIWARKTS